MLARPEREGESCAPLLQADVIAVGCRGRSLVSLCSVAERAGAAALCAGEMRRFAAKWALITENRLARRTKNGGTPPPPPQQISCVRV